TIPTPGITIPTPGITGIHGFIRTLGAIPTLRATPIHRPLRRSRRRKTRQTPEPALLHRQRRHRFSGRRCRRPTNKAESLVAEGRLGDIDWTLLDCVPPDCLWLRPLGLACGRAAVEAVACGHARPLAGAGLAFTLIAAAGLGSGGLPVSVTA